MEVNRIRRPREPVKTRELLGKLRKQIVEGVYPPGSRLPTRDELQVQHGVSAITVQRALDELGSDRFIEAHTRRGTFVVANPPHLAEFALVFNLPASHPRFSQFDLALLNEATGVGRARGKMLQAYYGVTGQKHSESFGVLCRRVLSQSLAGLIFSDDPYQVTNTPLMDEPGIPRVILAAETVKEGVPSLTVDQEDWMDKALNFMVARGHRRVGFISRVVFKRLERILAGLHQRGMETRPQWMQAPSIDLPASVSNCVHMLMSNSNDRPNALIIDDDHYVEMATAGLLATGVHSGEEVRVVAHCNFPWPTRSAVPVTRLGFDARQVLHACMDLLDRQRRGESVPRQTKIPAVFEEEIPGGAENRG